ncbi:30S ribosomal protein S2 [Candidatus Gottesmanbacteria bacterium RIFCSPHIGHO2_02_FULL_39_11]|uniref:Small ribosomal subunit protein uS2 n=1 Tax=Candidatus Gottesmanbacteria bacterium RIFCSPHIGHO2_02_FULL_39_11 TaxID=1798382 RepID=A0A1F5ZJP7_9BACT|nr:MAG: 30S ribosomal protein S2 [Candidatus Gottesmanbacteria bacterium RIFCSPHIGHO2_02_FULL_39_11]
MKNITLVELLEAGCHFGHKKEKWHPKAASFIYAAKEGVHIIDLAKTKEWLQKAGEYAEKLGQEGKVLMFVATKRQAKLLLATAAKKANAPYLASRWVGGFLTNWDQVKRNIDKLNKMKKDKAEGAWKKFVKHEIVKLDKEMKQIEMVYGGVADLKSPPDALFIVDIKKEDIAIKEAARREIPVIGMVDTNSDPSLISYPIPANDDAVGSIEIIVNFIAECYLEGKEKRAKEGEKEKERTSEKESREKAVEVKKPAAEAPTKPVVSKEKKKTVSKKK